MPLPPSLLRVAPAVSSSLEDVVDSLRAKVKTRDVEHDVLVS